MVNSWTPYVIASAFAVSALGIFVWKQKKKIFVKAGKISNLFYFPVKSLKGIEVNHGRLTHLGFEVDGLLDRSFMLVDEENVFLSQEQCPSLVLLTPEVKDNCLVISGPSIEPLRVEIFKSLPSNEKLIINVKFNTYTIDCIDCGEEAAAWFQNFLNKKGVRLVRFFPTVTLRKYTKNDPLFEKVKKEHPVGEFSPCHVISQPSIDDLNSRLEEKKISVFNFRPNVLVDDCDPYDEDSWEYMKFGSEAMLKLLDIHPRCLMTTNDPETGVLSQKEPLVSMRKYRLPSDPALLKLGGFSPCFGTGCAVLSPGDIKVGDEIFAVIRPKPKMQEKA